MQDLLGQLRASLTVGNLFVALTAVFQLLVSLLAMILTTETLIAADCGFVGRFANPTQQRKNEDQSFSCKQPLTK